MSMQTSGQQLMCVWQAVAMLDPGHSATKSTASKLTVQDITCNLAHLCPSINYSSRIFIDNFPNTSVDFSDYVNYVKVCLRDYSLPMATLEDEFEVNCWDMCKDSYSLHHCSMKESEILKMWQIFNRLCMAGTIPPVMEYNDIQWLGRKFASGANQRWSSHHDGQLTFMEVLLDIDAVCFKVLNHCEVADVVDSVHSWLVMDVARAGWMSKRTRKQANWTSWQKRWFVLKPGLLSYYTSPAMTEKKGDIILTTRSRVDDLADFKMLIRHYPNRFRITNAPFIEIELSSEMTTDKDDWMRSVKLDIKAQTSGICPSEYNLKEIRKLQAIDRLSLLETNLSSQDVAGRRITDSDGFNSDQAISDNEGARQSSFSNTGSFDDYCDIDHQRSVKRVENSNWAIPFVMTRINEIAKQRGTDGNMNDNGFQLFLKDLGILLPGDLGQRLFEELNDNGSVSVKDFLAYLLKVLLFTKVPEDSLSERFLRASLQAYGKSSCMLNLTDFTEALWRKQRKHYVHLIMVVMDSVDSQSEDTLKQLQCAFSREQSVLGSLDEDKPCEAGHDEILHEAMQVNADQLAQYLHQKWASYPLKTDGSDGKTSRVPHEKTLLDVVFYEEPRVLMEPPASTVIEMVTWKRGSAKGKRGIVMLPNDFDGIVKVSEPTADALLYYGAVCANHEGHLQATLMYEHNILNYMYNKATTTSCLVRQDMPALFCPLEDDCGVLVLGKQNDQVLELNAFYIPIYNTVYIPAGTIFCTSYMVGKWRTLIIQRVVSDSAHVTHMYGDVKFQFRYDQLPGYLV